MLAKPNTIGSAIPKTKVTEPIGFDNTFGEIQSGDKIPNFWN